MLIFISVFTPGTYAQTAIYVCATNGTVGYAYGGSASGLDQVELEWKALEECRKAGGVSCELYDYIRVNGQWIAFMIGHQEGYYNTILKSSTTSAQVAKDAAWLAYKNAGYLNIDYARIYTWYVPE